MSKGISDVNYEPGILKAQMERIKELEKRLEIDSGHNIDGISARDSTIDLLDRRLDEWKDIVRDLKERLAREQITNDAHVNQLKVTEFRLKVAQDSAHDWNDKYEHCYDDGLRLLRAAKAFLADLEERTKRDHLHHPNKDVRDYLESMPVGVGVLFNLRKVLKREED
jgi:hypothetical protein